MKILDFLQKKFHFRTGKCTLSVFCAGLRGERKGGLDTIFAQPGWFCAGFRPFFAKILPILGSFSVSVSTPQMKKSTPNFSAALTFFSRRRGFEAVLRLSA